jgi:hypothetical protein
MTEPLSIPVHAGAAEAIRVLYTNWKGETEVRLLFPEGIVLTDNPPYHTQKEWMLQAFDMDNPKKGSRLYPLSRIEEYAP